MGWTNAEIVRELVALMNDADASAIDRLYARDYLDHDPLPGQPANVDGVRAGIALLSRPGVGPRFHLEDCFAVDDRVAYRLFGTWQAPQEFAFDVLESRPTLWLSGVGIYRCRDGQLVERWGKWDLQGVTLPGSLEQGLPR